jgi:lactoylglutathione lyase
VSQQSNNSGKAVAQGQRFDETEKRIHILARGSWFLTSMHITQLNHVAIHVADVERSAAFYRDVLKLQPIPRPAFTFPGAWFRLGTDQELHLIGERQEQVISHNRGNHFALMVDDFEAWEQHLTECGARFASRRLRPDGVLQLYVIDPDGHYVELCKLP